MKNRLKEFRALNKGITQEELARVIKVSRQTITYIERGKYKPSVLLALKIAKTLGCQVEDLFELEEEDWK
ncbi:MAG: helix-turn-helix transcriptional regulator [Thermotogae bacterium]|nr:helix-turn-helix transcriptional regulator [Thermotogota bacterium]